MVNFTLRQLQIFLEAATYSSFSEAAKYLHMSKPAVTKQIQVLESQLNVKLFNRLGRGIRLTLEGKRLLPQIKTILDEANKMKKIVELGIDQSKPMLTFSTGHTYSGLLFTAMKHFSKLHDVEFEVFVEPKESGYKRIERGNAIFLLTGVKVDDSNFKYIPFLNVQFYLVAAKSNPSIPKGKITIQDINHLTFLRIKAESHQTVLLTQNEYVNQHFSKIIQLESYYSIKEAIKSNLGIGVLPETLLYKEMDELNILPIKPLQFKRQIYLITNKEKATIKDQFINYVLTDFKIDHFKLI
jgi:DNA-binding transcriptional LysR family regulator